MVKFGFFLMNKRGYEVITNFVEQVGVNAVAYVVGSKDKNIQEDWFDEIRDFCRAKQITWAERGSVTNNLNEETYKVAIGWRWLIEGVENLIVLHDSLLPKYRGFAPLVNALINGERMLGVTALFATSEYDAGDVIAQRSVGIDYPLKIFDAIDCISPLYSDLVVDIYSALTQGSIRRYPQSNDAATYSPWLDDKDYKIDWTWSASKIERFVNAVGYPYSGAQAVISGQIISIESVCAMDDVDVENRARHIGKVLFLSDQCPIVICGEGLLKILSAKDKDGKSLQLPFRTRFE